MIEAFALNRVRVIFERMRQMSRRIAPGWVKMTGLVVAAFILTIIGLLLAGHGPWQHVEYVGTADIAVSSVV